LLATSLGACGAKTKRANEAMPTVAPIAAVTGNPFQGVEVFWPPYTNADQAKRRLEKTDPAAAQLIGKIADTPQAKWLGEWSGEIETVTQNFTRAADRAGKVPLIVAYNLPNRDCGQYSAGGVGDPVAYRAWVDAMARGISEQRRAIVILEPDALGQLDICLDEPGQAERLELLTYAVTKLESLPGVSVYVDAGHSRWVKADVMAQRLRAAGVGKARGFSLNVANYVATAELLEYGNGIASQLGGDVHFVIDTGRNGNGAPDATGEASWCNVPGRALGARPTTETGDSRVDAFAWIKNPGESDGTCAGGPPAGQWFHERALEMARNATW
jgi:endoglucanase